MIDTISLIILLTLLAHIVEDFHLQGKMADMKQKSWWAEQWAKHNGAAPKLPPRYRHDYVIVLILHGLEWSICVSLPALILSPNAVPWQAVCVLIVTMGLLHAFVDHAKANTHLINLWQDQMTHMAQLALILAVLLW